MSKSALRLALIAMIAIGISVLLFAVGCGGGTTTTTAAPVTTAAAAPDTTATTAAPAETSTTAAAPTGVIDVPKISIPPLSKKYKLGAALVQGGEPFQESVKIAMQEEAAKQGVELIVSDVGGYGDPAKQVSQIENLVTQKVDAILLWAASYEGTGQAVDAAVAAGIPVISIVTPTKSDKVSTWVGIDDKAVGGLLAGAQGEAMGGKGKTAMISGAEGAAWSKLASDGYRETMKAKYPGITIVDERWTPNLDPDTAMKLAEDLLLKNPDLTGMYTLITSMAFGASKAIESANLTGKIKLASISIQGKDDISLIESGQVAAVVGEPAMIIGRWGIDYALKVLEKETVPPFVAVPSPIYTKDNVAQADFSLELAPKYLK